MNLSARAVGVVDLGGLEEVAGDTGRGAGVVTFCGVGILVAVVACSIVETASCLALEALFFGALKAK